MRCVQCGRPIKRAAAPGPMGPVCAGRAGAVPPKVRRRAADKPAGKARARRPSKSKATAPLSDPRQMDWLRDMPAGVQPSAADAAEVSDAVE